MLMNENNHMTLRSLRLCGEFNVYMCWASDIWV
jgi:hypothetical protein